MKRAQATETEVLPAVRLDPITVPHKPQSFREASRDLKARMIREYLDLPANEKLAWREEHDCTQSVMNYYRVRLKKERKEKIKATESTGYYLGIGPELLAEYKSLELCGKSQWLKRYGLNHQQIFEVKKRLEKQGLVAYTPPANGHKASSNSISHRHIPVAAPTHATSLDDAINSMKVKRDMLSEFIADLERMRH